MTPPSPVTPSTSKTPSNPTAPQAGASGTQAESSGQTTALSGRDTGGLRRRDLESASTGRSSAPRRAASTLFGSRDSQPVTQVVAFGGGQFVNRTHTGPLGGPPTLGKWPPIQPAAFDIRVPPDAQKRASLATQSLADCALKYRPWLDSVSLNRKPESDLAPAAEVAKHAVQRVGQAVGLATPSRPAAGDLGPTAKGQPDRYDLAALVDVTKSKDLLTHANYAATGIRRQIDVVVACAAEGLGKADALQLKEFRKVYERLAKNFHSLDAELESKGKGDATLKPRRDQAQKAFDAHKQKFPESLDGPWKKRLEEAFRYGNEALGAVAHASQRKVDSDARLRRVQELELEKLRDNPPGVTGTPPAQLTAALGQLGQRFLTRPQEAEKLSCDALMGIALACCTGAFPASDPNRNAKMAEALQHLQATDLQTLRQQVEHLQGSEPARQLAREIATLPRGMEVLQAICRPSDFLTPRPASESKADQKAAAELGQRRSVAMQCLFKADRALHREETSMDTRANLGRAKEAAHQLLRSPSCMASELADKAQRYAFNSVRNDVAALGNGTAAESINEYLKDMTAGMRAPGAAPSGIAGHVASMVPAASPLSTTAIEGAAKTLKQAGLTRDTLDAVRDMRGAVDDLPKVQALHQALEQCARALIDAIPDQHPEQLASLDAGRVELPPNFGLDDAQLAAHPRLNALWTDYHAGRMSPDEAVRQLAEAVQNIPQGKARATEAEGAQKSVSAFLKALDLARCSAIWQQGKIDTPQQLAEAIVAVMRQLSLRDRIKLTGGRGAGIDLSKAPIGFAVQGPLAINLRLNVGGKAQKDRVLEFGMSTQAYYLTVGTQTTVGGRAGASAGLNLSGGVGDGTVRFGARVLEAGASAGYEVQWQEGVLMRIPRDKTTEKTNLKEAEQMVRQAILWQSKGYDTPLHSVLSEVDAASTNLLGQYDRRSARGEAAVGSYAPQLSVGNPEGGPRGQARTGAQARTQGDHKVTTAMELTGYYKYQERRVDELTLLQTVAAATAALQVGSRGGVSAGLADMATYSQAADRPGGSGINRRIVTMDGITLPLRSRLITEHSDRESYRRDLEADRARWVGFGTTYTKFPEGFEEKQAQTEKDLDRFHEVAQEWERSKGEVDRNILYSVVNCLQEEVAAPHDALEALARQAERGGRAQESQAADTKATQEDLLLTDTTWQPRRSAINVKISQINQPGLALGPTFNVSGNTDALHNLLLFPRG